MEAVLKNEIHILIDNCNNDGILMQVKQIFKQDDNIDWWNHLTETQQTDIAQLLNEPDEKDTISHSDFLKATERWSIK